MDGISSSSTTTTTTTVSLGKEIGDRATSSEDQYSFMEIG